MKQSGRPMTVGQEHKNIGAAIHNARMELGMSREDLAKKLDLTHQQVAKYEKGTNRVCFHRMLQMAEILEKPLDYFSDSEFDPPQSNRGNWTYIRAIRKFHASNDNAKKNIVLNLINTIF